ncbi:unnamed protein product [Malus baccata var. baccata]
MILASFKNYMDDVLMRKSTSLESESYVAEMMCQIKKVTYGRIRNKIYGVLLKHVGRTAMVLEHMNLVIRDRQL